MEPKERRGPGRRLLATAGTVVLALVVAVATAIGTGLGDKLLGLTEDDPPLVTASDGEEVYECGTRLFVPQPAAADVVAAGVDADAKWTEFKRTNDASAAGTSVALISIQGESSRTITLTGLEFDVERGRRPDGAVFANPCGGPINGRSVVVDLDRRPAAIVRSTEDPKGIAGVPDDAGRLRPIRFPWTVSVTDPLLLFIIARTENCFCTWRAYANWRSGGQSGRIVIDNGGAGYTVVGQAGVDQYSNAGRERGWVSSPPLR